MNQGGGKIILEDSYLRGDIFYADLNDSIGSEQRGYRPVLIIQNDYYNRTSPTVVVASITSKVETKPEMAAHYFIDTDGGLSRPSIVLLEQLRTIDKKRFLTYIGHLNRENIYGVNKGLCACLDLHRIK